jgi:GT2 family glycosyltransferase
MTGIILVNYNSASKTQFCLESIKKQTYKDIKVYLLDNFSNTNEKLLINNLCSEYESTIKIDLFDLNENIGFSRANNLLIKKALSDGCNYIYILNNDVELLSDTVEKFIKIVESKNVEIVTNKILFRSEKNKIWFAGGIFDYKNADYKTVGYKEIDSDKYSKIYSTDWASGASSFYTRDVFSKIGLYDEAYFFGQEEWDLSLSAIKKNIEILYDGSNPVYHDVGGSTKFRLSFKIYLNTYNRLYFAKKNLKLIDYYLFFCKYFFYSIFLKRKTIKKTNGISIPFFKFYKIQILAIYHFYLSKKINFEVLQNIDSRYA